MEDAKQEAHRRTNDAWEVMTDGFGTSLDNLEDALQQIEDDSLRQAALWVFDDFDAALGVAQRKLMRLRLLLRD